jgi:hypothetical protein
MPRLVLDTDNRLTLSSEVCALLGVAPGDVLVLQVVEGGVLLSGREQMIQSHRDQWQADGNGMQQTLDTARGIHDLRRPGG